MPRTWIVIPLAFGAMTLSAALFSGAASAGSPSFDCARADSRAEELVCGDRELASMDVEATRLFRLVRDGSERSDDEKKALNDDRARWLKVRDECWIAENLRTCIIAAYARRIHSLRENHAEARTSDDKGITKGPYVMRCEDLKEPVKATFISSDPPVSTVQLPDSVYVGIGSGARYMERTETGAGMMFWMEGDDAYLRLPGGVNYKCAVARE